MKKRRVVLELSGKVLANANDKGYNETVVRDIARQVKRSVGADVKAGIVIGSGNYWRDRIGTEIARMKVDQIEMPVAVINCIHVSEIFRDEGMEVGIFGPFLCDAMTELFLVDKANALFAAGRAFLFVGGTGHPCSLVGTGIALRAVELGVDEVLLVESVDGVYTADPKLDPDVKRYDTLTVQEMIDKKLEVTDLTADVLRMENKIPFAVFDLYGDSAIADALRSVVHDTTVTV